MSTTKDETGNVFNVTVGDGSQVQLGEGVTGTQARVARGRKHTIEMTLDQHDGTTQTAQASEEYEFDLRVEQPIDTWTLRRKFEGNPAILQRIVNHDADTVITMYVPDELLEMYARYWMKHQGFRVVDAEDNEVQEATKKLDYPACGHSACRQNWCDTGETLCLQNEDEVDAYEELRKELAECGQVTDNYEDTIRTAAGIVSDHRRLVDEIGNIRRRLRELASRAHSEMTTVVSNTTADIGNLADQLQKAEDNA